MICVQTHVDNHDYWFASVMVIKKNGSELMDEVGGIKILSVTKHEVLIQHVFMANIIYNPILRGCGREFNTLLSIRLL